MFNIIVDPATIANKMEMQSLVAQKNVLKIYGKEVTSAASITTIRQCAMVLLFSEKQTNKNLYTKGSLDHSAKNNKEF